MWDYLVLVERIVSADVAERMGLSELERIAGRAITVRKRRK
jgi:hypothetical protein